MSRHYYLLCLGASLLLALTGICFAQDTLPVIWMVQAHDQAIESVAFSAEPGGHSMALPCRRIQTMPTG
jgi:hypothetical protein